jgi:hypothetical protein
MIALVPHIVRSQEITPVNLRGIAAGADQTIRLIRSIPEPAGRHRPSCTRRGRPGGAEAAADAPNRVW